MSPWWDLPGPGSFVEDLADDLRDGRSITVELPDYAPPGLPDAVRDALGGQWGWRHLDRPPASGATSFIYDRCLPHVSTDHRTPRTLVQEVELYGFVIWIDHVAPPALPAWRSFLTSYAEAVRGQRDDFARFALCIRGEEPSETSIPADLPLTRHRWDGRTDPLDMLSFAARIRHGRERTPLEQRLAVELVARLAAFDPNTATRLADLALPELHAPADALAALAHERGWPCGDNAREALAGPAWHEGMADTYHGSPRLHPALLAAAGATEALERLVWQAQITVVFPFLEERRRDLLDALDPVLTVPFEYRHRIVNEKADLELGHIYAQLVRLGQNVPKSLLNLATDFRDARNHLAHLRPLRPGTFRTASFDAYRQTVEAGAQRLRQR